jgi:hypothetical protein
VPFNEALLIGVAKELEKAFWRMGGTRQFAKYSKEQIILLKILVIKYNFEANQGNRNTPFSIK